MKKAVLIASYSVSAVILLFLGVVVITNILVKNKFEKFLTSRLPNHITQDYESISLNTWGGTITVNELTIMLGNKTDSVVHTKVSVAKLIVENVSYWDYLMHSEIHIEDIKINSPTISYYTHRVHKKQDAAVTSGSIKLYKPILVDALSINNALLYIYDNEKDSLVVYVENSAVTINDITIDKDIINRRLPVEFKKYKASADSIFVKTNAFENLTVTDFNLEDKKAVFNTIKLKTKYSKNELSQKITTERDHFDLEAKKLTVDAIAFGFEDRMLFLSSAYVTIDTPDLKMFRDKLVADDVTIKKLYSQSLRELPFQLTVDSVAINNASIEYTEKVKPENNGGSIYLNQLNVKIANVSNTYKAPEHTKLEIEGSFMENAPFKSQWDFDVNNPNDDFVFSMQIGELQADRLNTFTEPNLKMRLSGQTDKIYYTIDGNRTTSSVDLKVKYENFEISVLNKQGNKKNWVLSTVANLFVSKDSQDKSDNFREASAEVERNKTKSVFNFIWLNLSKGLLKSIAGNGEK
ncbi:hypothetical protein ES676_06850 [Bizionia saleffrena]|uniref:DUF748 domain-containing protein n=1 Tax=Bizionia saleffrena TaxID=291189 RepID=A0A8H2QLJ7_9FLAO|nr:hypothetical protein [Bizionia saleffrena]TYB74388.1 hypothetical protein ES676_06850 [Bizionia saleffrena]